MLINCVIGECGIANEIDDALMELIDIAVIACGEHAGDSESIRYYQELAKEHGVKRAAYLSYPSKERLPEGTMSIEHDDVISFLNEQAIRFGPIECVKFQGLLYDHVNRSPELAERIGEWLKEQGVKEVIAPYRSMLHKACITHRIPVLYEAYADRVYREMNVGLELMPQNQIGTLIESIDNVLKQVRKLKQGIVTIDDQNYLIEAETICIDSNSKDVLEKVRTVKNLLNR